MGTKTFASAAILLVALGCTKQETTTVTENAKSGAANVAQKVQDAWDAAVPIGKKEDPKAREQERFDQHWRDLQAFKEVKMAQPQGPTASDIKVQFVPNGKESFKGLDANAINAAPVVVPVTGDVAGPSVLKTQVYLDRSGFSVGALDGRWGKNSAIALWWFQRSRGLNATDPGALDEQTYRTLAAGAGAVPALVQRTLTEDDVKGPFVTLPDDVYEKEKLDCLCYESLPEKLAERFHTTVELLEQLNPGV